MDVESIEKHPLLDAGEPARQRPRRFTATRTAASLALIAGALAAIAVARRGPAASSAAALAAQMDDFAIAQHTAPKNFSHNKNGTDNTRDDDDGDDASSLKVKKLAAQMDDFAIAQHTAPKNYSHNKNGTDNTRDDDDGDDAS